MESLAAKRALFLIFNLAFGVVGLAPVVASPYVGSSIRAVPLIVESVDETKRIVLNGNTRPEALQPEFDRGAVEDSFPMNGIQLQLRRSAGHEQAAENLAEELHRGGSPVFHQWLSAAQYADQFGVHPNDVARIGDWLRGHGFTVHAQSLSRMTIEFSGTAGQVRDALGTEIHSLEVRGVRHIANARDPSVPAALAPVVAGVVSLHDFRPHSQTVHRGTKSATAPQYTYVSGSGTYHAVVPADLARIYNFNPLFAAGITGKGQTIALVEGSNLYRTDDWRDFRATFGLDVYGGGSLRTAHPGKCADPGDVVTGIYDLEAIIDVEWASAAAPSADILLASCADSTTTWGGLIATQNLLNQATVPSIISDSYGVCETYNGAAANAAYKAVTLQGVLEGVSLFVAAGDSGADLCALDYPSPSDDGITVNALASSPYVVAVGGTDFGDSYAGTQPNYWAATNGPTYASAQSYIPEIPWNDTCTSELIYTFLGYTTALGPNGFCLASLNYGGNATTYFTAPPYAGSGGPSNCATGADVPNPSLPGTAYPANGTCRGWPKPSWQKVLGNPDDGVRDLPDVSMFSSDGVWNALYIVCYSNPAGNGVPCVGAPSNWYGDGGTSFASPIMAGVQALVNQVWGGRQGNPNPVYYALARLEYGAKGNSACASFAPGGPAAYCVFNDITVGDNDIDCASPYNCYDPGWNLNSAPGVFGALSLSNAHLDAAYKAHIGWDFTTGIGSVNAAQLVLNPIWAQGANW
jgi:subtilase family serine protease